MEITKFRSLARLSLLNELPKTNLTKNQTVEELEQKSNLTDLIIQSISFPSDIQENRIKNSIIDFMVKHYELMGSGIFSCPFEIKTKYGAGKFFEAHSFFEDNKYPKFVRKRYCHSNSYEFAKTHNKECTVLSGVAYRRKSFLHSVVQIGDYILDFNYDLVMDKELYMKLFNFVVVSEVKSQDIKENDELMKEKLSNRVNYGEMNFCYYELLEAIKNNNLLI